MKNVLKNLIAMAMTVVPVTTVIAQQKAAHLDMSAANGMITDKVSQLQFSVNSQLPVCNVNGLDGEALRFDGYSNYVEAALPVSSFSKSQLTISIVLAAETYPMMNVAEAEYAPTYATIFGNLDENTREGFAIELSSQGNLRLRFGSAYANGFLFTANGTKTLQCGRWNMVTAVLDKNSNKASLYLNGEEIGSCKMSRSDIRYNASKTFMIGKDETDLKSGCFLINTFCGLIDDIVVYNESLSSDKIAQMASKVNATKPDFNYPASRYAESLWRPQFHGMPSGGWTNECHGMTYSDGKYHVFFQKNANGPYMARLHWGHISSENLYKWTEEPIAIAPGEAYDIKGCWSGCVFDDNNITNILYTAVDNGRAVIAHATPEDKGLVSWTKQGIAINGRPSGLSDDFRDPYFFSADGNKYVIVGTGKDGIGACTLHKYENGSWTNDGRIFFRGTNGNQHGTFWEMPNMTYMGNGKWLFTVTPLGMGSGVRTIYWIGKVNGDGTFTPDNDQPKTLEINGISKDGYGLLSPTIYQKDGKTILLGIVPDKLPSEVNSSMGWAHNYSLPREISIAENGELIQKPLESLKAMRTDVCVEKSQELFGEMSLSPVCGRQIELLGEFTVGSGEMGFHFFKSTNGKATLSYNTNNGMLTLDFTTLARRSNDGGSYNGVYSTVLPDKPMPGEKLKMHVFIDGSIADIFINDKWAYSVRMFPTDIEQIETEVFATSPVEVSVKAWTLDAERSGSTPVKEIFTDALDTQPKIFNLAGQQCPSIPQKGVFIKNGKKYVAN